MKSFKISRGLPKRDTDKASQRCWEKGTDGLGRDSIATASLCIKNKTKTNKTKKPSVCEVQQTKVGLSGVGCGCGRSQPQGSLLRVVGLSLQGEGLR